MSSIINPNSLGGAIKGYMAKPIGETDRTFENFGVVRLNLREAWNTKYASQLMQNNKKRIITPFRAVTNSGDLLCRTNYSCGGPNQAPSSRPNVRGISNNLGSILSKCDGSNIPASSCNVKYVYDSSDYITYLKQKAVNKNYNDLSTGSSNNSSQSAIKAIRRY